MKKEMFKDRYNLTYSVLTGSKTMKRVVPHLLIKEYDQKYKGKDNSPTLAEFLDKRKKEYYSIGEEVAVAQSYEDLLLSGYSIPKGAEKEFAEDRISFRNKLYVKAEFMPHRFIIVDIRVERLQDITDEDCISEGVIVERTAKGVSYLVHGIVPRFKTPREAFAVLFDRICGKGTWESNPYVFVYSFEMIRQ